MGKKEPRPEFRTRPPACLEPSSVVEINSNNSGVGNERAMAVEARDLQNRLREQVTQLLGENSTFQRLMYKSCNQHRRATYFRRLAQIRRDFQLLQLLGLPELIETFIQFVAPEKQATATAKTGSLFPGLRGTEAKQQDRISVQRRLLGTARLLQQMAEPILDASSQITGLLSQSFFMPFALTMLALLARFRVLVLQVLYEVIAAFNLVAASSQCRQESGSMKGMVLYRYQAVKRAISAKGLLLCHYGWSVNGMVSNFFSLRNNRLHHRNLHHFHLDLNFLPLKAFLFLPQNGLLMTVP